MCRQLLRYARGLATLAVGAPAMLAATTGTVTSDRVNVRGQPSVYSETVTQLRAGETVEVLEVVEIERPKAGAPAQWLKIALPGNTTVWVNATFVDEASRTVKASRLNLRAGPGENFSVIGRIEEGETVRAIRVLDDWMEIEPPQGAYGFVAASYITLATSQDVAKAAVPPSPPGRVETTAVSPSPPSPPSGVVQPSAVVPAVVPVAGPEATQSQPAEEKTAITVTSLAAPPPAVALAVPAVPPEVTPLPETSVVDPPAAVQITRAPSPVAVPVPGDRPVAPPASASEAQPALKQGVAVGPPGTGMLGTPARPQAEPVTEPGAAPLRMGQPAGVPAVATVPPAATRSEDAGATVPAPVPRGGQPEGGAGVADTGAVARVGGTGGGESVAAPSLEEREAGEGKPAVGRSGKRIIEREGIVVGTFSIQAPTSYQMKAVDTGKRLNFLLITSPNVRIGQYFGQRVVVRGEEQLDPRWPNQPMIDVERIDLAP